MLSSQEFADGSREEGYRYLSSFSYEDTPVWRFLANGVEIEKEAAMRQGENTAAVIYRGAEQIEEGYQTHGHTLCPVCVQGERCRGGAGVPVRGRTDPERRPDPFDQDG